MAPALDCMTKSNPAITGLPGVTLIVVTVLPLTVATLTLPLKVNVALAEPLTAMVPPVKHRPDVQLNNVPVVTVTVPVAATPLSRLSGDVMPNVLPTVALPEIEALVLFPTVAKSVMLSARAKVGTASANRANKRTRLINHSSEFRSRLFGAKPKMSSVRTFVGPAVASPQHRVSAEYDYYLAYGLPK